MEVLPGIQLVTWPSLVPIFFGHVDIMSFAANPLTRLQTARPYSILPLR